MGLARRGLSCLRLQNSMCWCGGRETRGRVDSEEPMSAEREQAATKEPQGGPGHEERETRERLSGEMGGQAKAIEEKRRRDSMWRSEQRRDKREKGEQKGATERGEETSNKRRRTRKREERRPRRTTNKLAERGAKDKRQEERGTRR